MIPIKQMMIFAAGRGSRLQPLTNLTPKPLVKVRGKPLIFYHLEGAAAAGIESVVINVSYLRQQIIDALGDGSRWGVHIEYSIEPQPLETAGGLVKARHLLDDGEFLLVNADIYHHLNLSEFLEQARQPLHLLMVPNPQEQPNGNFLMAADGLIWPLDDYHCAGRALTYGGMGVFNTEFIESIDQLGSGNPEHERTPFYMKQWMRQGRVSGFLYENVWCDVGTPERLAALNMSAEK